MNIKKYNQLPLIKSDTSENLKDYWTKAYSNDSLDFLLKRFEDNLIKGKIKNKIKILRNDL